MPTLLCVPIMVDSHDQTLADAICARDNGADLVELRIDTFVEDQSIETAVKATRQLIDACPLPVVLTCRHADEGGHNHSPEHDRLEILTELAIGPVETRPRYVDLELAALEREPDATAKLCQASVTHEGAGLIVSIHDFNHRPADLLRKLTQADDIPGIRILKVAYMARSLRDNIELFELLEHTSRPTIALAMGPFGQPSRILAPKFNAFLTFAALRDEQSTAPGQPTLSDLRDTYRFASIKPTTKTYGILGDPVDHSLSPHLHNAGFEATNHDGVYLRLPVPTGWEHFKATLADLIEHQPLDFSGASVTQPHKENLVRFARQRIDAGDTRWSIDPVAQIAGAANTLAITRNINSNYTRAYVTTTDASAVRSCLEEHLGDLEGTCIALIGAGGVARSIAAGLALAGAHVCTMNRTESRAQELADAINAQVPDAVTVIQPEQLPESGAAALVNCTPVGTAGIPHEHDLPIEGDILTKWADATKRNMPAGGVVLESVYTPEHTPLVQRAQSLDLPVVLGSTFFLRQAGSHRDKASARHAGGGGQFELWTGQAAPSQLFERICNEQLSIKSE